MIDPNATQNPQTRPTRGQGYLSESPAICSRVPTGHPEGYLEAFATIYCDIVTAIRAHIDGLPLAAEHYGFATVYDGLRGMQFSSAGVGSSEQDGVWIAM